MANKNCLEGIRCPECGYEDGVLIAATIHVHVTDEGTEEGGDTEWTDASYCQCAGCKHAATVKDFTIENQSENPADTIKISWHIDDVKEERPDLTDEQCREVLSFCKRKHDATIGINWEVICIWAEHLYPEKDAPEAAKAAAEGGAA